MAQAKQDMGTGSIKKLMLQLMIPVGNVQVTAGTVALTGNQKVNVLHI